MSTIDTLRTLQISCTEDGVVAFNGKLPEIGVAQAIVVMFGKANQEAEIR